ncbi:MAG: class I SAM-dependent methyltransferase [Ignavibacteria bacterium]|nr:class I SAM-dependent methyltransferase [Ignavibacteria bacterium]
MIDTYKSLCTEFYDLDKPLAPDDALEYYLNQIQLSSQPVLEPMCGTGRFLIPLFEKGIDIDGIDASEHMLEKCRIKAGEKNLHPKLYLQKLEDMSGKSLWISLSSFRFFRTAHGKSGRAKIFKEYVR